MKTTIKHFHDFIHTYGIDLNTTEVYAKTRHQEKRVLNVAITAKDSRVVQVILQNGYTLIGSPLHKVLNDAIYTVKWKYLKDIRIGTSLVTDEGCVEVLDVQKNFGVKMDLYDLQIQDVEEYYTNGIVSHNSTISDSLKLGLYGKTSNRNLKDIANKHNKYGEVLAEFKYDNKKVEVFRRFSPNDFKIFIDDVEYDVAGKSDKQTYLEDELLKISFYVFNNMISLSLNDFKSFLKMTPSDKRLIIDKIFSLAILNAMREDVKKQIKEKTVELTTISNNISFIEKNIEKTEEELQNLLEKLNENREQEIQDNEKKLKEIQDSLEVLNSKLSEVSSSKESISKDTKELSEELQKINSEISTLSKSIRTYELKEKEIQELLEKLNNSKQQEIQEYEEKLNSIQENLISLKEDIENLKVKKDELVLESKNIQSEISKYNSEIQTLSKSLKLYENHECPTCGSDLTSDTHQEHCKEIQKELDGYIGIKEEKEKLYKSVSDKVSETETKYLDVSAKFSSMQTTKKQIESKISELKSEEVGLSEDSLKSMLVENQTKKIESSEKIESYTLLKEDKNTVYSEISDKLKSVEAEYYDVFSKVTSTQTTKKQVEAYLNTLRNQENDNLSIESLTKILDDSKSRKEEFEKNQEGYGKKIKFLGIVDEILSEKGIKQMIIANLIPSLNDMINSYLEKFNLYFTIEFDEEFNANIFSNGIEVDVSTLSMGETKILDFVVLISMIKLLKTKYHNLNVMFLDEIFASLDLENATYVIRMLKELSKELRLNIFVVHHNQLPTEYFDNVISVEKENGFSNLRYVR